MSTLVSRHVIVAASSNKIKSDPKVAFYLLAEAMIT
jgi:hypothetical protein